MTATLQNFEIVKANTKDLRIPVTENGWPRALTGLTAEWDMATAAGAASILSKTTGGGGIDIPAAVTGTAQSGERDSIVLEAGASSVDGIYQGRHVRITGGTGAGQWRLIDDVAGRGYNGDTKRAYVTKGWNTAPDATSTYEIVDSALDVTIDDADTASLAAGDYFHRARIADGAGEPSTVTTGTASLIDGIA